jgi:molybdate transport system substrate-binding protein
VRRAPARAAAALVTACLALALALALVLAGCGEKSEPSTATLTVSAASSLKTALDAYDRSFTAADVRAQYAGSDELAAQIERGLRPDVYAAANTQLPAALHAKGLVDAPRVFAANEIVLAVPADKAKVRSLDDLARRGITIAIGAAGVPVGSYTRAVLHRLGAARERAIVANVRSEEPDVKGVVGKLVQGAVDAGFVYRSDVRAAGGALTAIALPPRLSPPVAYAVAAVRGSPHAAAARRYVAGLLRGAGQDALRAAGFAPPPR